MRQLPLPIFGALLVAWLGMAPPASGAPPTPPPASIADTDLTPQAGEIRLEGTLNEMDAAQGRLVLLATRVQGPGRPAQGIDPPRPKIILVRPATSLRPGPGAQPVLSAFQAGDAVIVVGKSRGQGQPLAARVIAAGETASATVAAPAKSAPETVRRFLAARSAGRYAEAYALLSRETQREVPFDMFQGTANLPKGPTMDGMTMTSIYALFIDSHNTLGYQYQVLGAAPDDPTLVLVRVQFQNAAPFQIKIATVSNGADLHLDLLRSFVSTDPHAFEMMRRGAEQTASLSNVRQIGLGIIQYAADHNDTLPDADKWVDEIMPYLKNEQIFHAPGAPAGLKWWSYAFNKALSGAKMASLGSPDTTVMIFESTLGTKNASDDGASLPHPGWYRNGIDYGFADGHARWLPDSVKASFKP